jgi:6-phosphofructokinase
MEPSKFAVLTSGGDAPGMNAAIRAIVRTGIHLGHTIVGIERGFQGLLEANFRTLSARDVGGVLVGMQKGRLVCVPYAMVIGKAKGLDRSLLRMVELLAA